MKHDLALYSTAAEVIPLLLGFLAFELHAFAADEEMRGAGRRANLLAVATFVILILLLALGEYAAIHVLARGVATGAARSAVLTALFAGGVSLTLGILQTSMRPLFPSHPTALRVLSSAALVVAVFLWLIAS